MTIKRIDASSALELLREAVAERGEDYVYGKGEVVDCRYRWLYDDDTPGAGPAGAPACIVGVVLDKLGVLEEVVPDPSESRNSLLLHQLADSIDLPLTGGAVQVLQEAQMAQDAQATWGEALNRAARLARQIGDAS